MAERPICTECEYYRLIKARGNVIGYECYCMARSRNGRMIDSQYGLSHKWTREELKDRMQIKMCPGWCSKWRRT